MSEQGSLSGMDPASLADLRAKVFATIVAPNFEAEIRDLSSARHRWRKVANFFEGFAQLAILVSTITAAAAGFYPSSTISFITSALCASSLAMSKFVSYAESESGERNTILNRLLSYLGLSPVPSISAEDGSAPQRDAQSVHRPDSELQTGAQHAQVIESPPLPPDDPPELEAKMSSLFSGLGMLPAPPGAGHRAAPRPPRGPSPRPDSR
jgi:hypothetical protein